jgi:hypothetical protein
MTRLEKIFSEADQMDERIAEFGLLSQAIRVALNYQDLIFRMTASWKAEDLRPCSTLRFWTLRFRLGKSSTFWLPRLKTR